VFHPDAEVIGDIGATVTALADRLDGKLAPNPELMELRRAILERLNDRANDGRFPLTPQRIIHDVRAVVPDDGIVCLDNGMYKIWFAATTAPRWRTHCCWTTRSPPWAPACPRR